MQGNPQVLDCLNQLLAGELAARDQYFIHSRMYHDWGYSRLHERIAHEMEDETGHASSLIERILLLGGTPNMQVGAIDIGKDVPAMLASDLRVELHVQGELKKAIALCEQQQDYVSRTLLVEQLKDTEEDHAHWLEQQLLHIEQMGLPNYLQSQAR
ncbi:MAG: bacterioferritin [Pseudomonadota bacterium]|nr:bacterioferritin [Pseudomonadota bacterium]